ncbi:MULTISPECIES: hypothetical protein [Vibrio]|uniref:hypothetical protein n=1 Tax=Vibrio TaxID=662 RepID=UPI0020763850|nr:MULTISPECIES: hypothetical protein [Vibrio]USD33939.1 hypothetical protein J8Z27_07590 [Vibrio sp. SCSIO 43186]USD47041.1 hypothetical protein J4N38_07975 [Vibrio sp. SCSIO 43145]USD71063.1 hypothetical protein J4N41_07595 [Vibrio sp. SCSIO 43139]USD95969.1 hypothetical protein CTT30_07700 [Vibrio coralliilyticus]
MNLKSIFLTVTAAFSLLSLTVFATTLDDIRPHVPSSDKTWAEQWFYNVAVPDVGYFKISLQSYIAPDFDEPTPKAYVHLAFTPLNGKTIKYDIFRDKLIMKGFDDATLFHYEIPGVVVANQDSVEVTYNDFHFSMRWDGEHAHYWRGLNPGQTPFGIIPELPGVGGKWFLYTVGTPIQYSFSDGDVSLFGSGYAQVDKGWYDKESSAGMVYSMGLSDDLYYMFTGAKIGNSNIELWAGRYISDNYDLIFYPAIGNLSVKREYDSCAGYLKVEMNKLRYKMVMEAKSDLDDFYPLEFPSVIIFGGEQKYMKSMKADVKFSLYDFGQLEESIEIPQALLEFSGPFYCDALSTE